MNPPSERATLRGRIAVVAGASARNSGHNVLSETSSARVPAPSCNGVRAHGRALCRSAGTAPRTASVSTGRATSSERFRPARGCESPRDERGSALQPGARLPAHLRSSFRHVAPRSFAASRAAFLPVATSRPNRTHVRICVTHKPFHPAFRAFVSCASRCPVAVRPIGSRLKMLDRGDNGLIFLRMPGSENLVKGGRVLWIRQEARRHSQPVSGARCPDMRDGFELERCFQCSGLDTHSPDRSSDETCGSRTAGKTHRPVAYRKVSCGPRHPARRRESVSRSRALRRGVRGW
jgi:hypothetical protein